MPTMRRILPALLLVLMAVAPGFGQAAGGMSAGGTSTTSGTVVVGTDVNEITKRILSSTKYKLTPGDTYQLIITLGERSQITTLVLQENYDLEIPYLNTLNVKGMYFDELRKTVLERLKKILPRADFINILLLTPSRFDVTVYGSVESPGIVTVDPLSRVSDGITLAKGVKKGASVRRILLFRGGNKIPVDLVLYGLENKVEENPFLQPGDEIFVPDIQINISVSGEVRYPGDFELLPGENLDTLLSLAGGILPTAQPGRVLIFRFNSGGTSSQLDLDLSNAAETQLQKGDRIRVPAMTENKDTVLVTGALFGAPVAADKPVLIPTTAISVNVPFTPGLTLLSVLESLGGPTPYARAKESVVIRGSGQRILVDVENLWAAKNAAQDIPLNAGDSISIPMVMDVYIVGEVRIPGKVPFSPAFTVRDYINLSGGVNPDRGDPNAIFFLDAEGNRAHVGMTDTVKPGSIILVDKNWWIASRETFDNINTVFIFITEALTFVGTAYSAYLGIKAFIESLQ